MKLEDQVCSLELAKRLNKLGVKQESLFWWINNEFESWDVLFTDGLKIEEISNGEKYSAFTVAELGELLHSANLIINTISTSVGNEPHKWCVALVKKIEHISIDSKKHPAGITEIGHLEHVEIEDTEANAKAKMLVYLLENKLIKL